MGNDVMAELRFIRMALGQISERLRPREKSALSRDEAAARLGVSVKTIQRMVKAGELVTVEIHSLRKIPVSEIERLVTPPEAKGRARVVPLARKTDGEAIARSARAARLARLARR